MAKYYTSTNPSLILGGGTGGSNLTMASTGQVLSYSSTGPTWSDPTVKTSIIFSAKDGTDVVLDAEVLLDIKALLEVIIELPDGHPLAEIKRDILVKKAMRTLGHK